MHKPLNDTHISTITLNRAPSGQVSLVKRSHTVRGSLLKGPTTSANTTILSSKL